MSVISEFRQGLQEQLAEDLEMVFFPGRFDGPNQSEQDLGSIFVQRVAEVGGHVLEQELYAVVRCFLRYEQPEDGEDVWDPAPLEDLAERLQASVREHQTGMGAWFQRVVTLELDPQVQGIEALIVGRATNAGVV